VYLSQQIAQEVHGTMIQMKVAHYAQEDAHNVILMANAQETVQHVLYVYLKDPIVTTALLMSN
jgi:hypothetical protein